MLTGNKTIQMKNNSVCTSVLFRRDTRKFHFLARSERTQQNKKQHMSIKAEEGERERRAESRGTFFCASMLLEEIGQSSHHEAFFLTVQSRHTNALFIDNSRQRKKEKSLIRTPSKDSRPMCDNCHRRAGVIIVILTVHSANHKQLTPYSQGDQPTPPATQHRLRPWSQSP